MFSSASKIDMFYDVPSVLLGCMENTVSGGRVRMIPIKKTPIRDELFPSTGDGHCGSSQSWLE